MQMKKKFIEERASMAVYVSVVLLCFLLILTSIYFSSLSVRKSQLTTILKVKQSYEKDNVDIDKIYQEQLAKFKDMTPPNATITVSSTAVLTSGSITATVTQRDNKQLDLSNCKYVYNTTSSKIGTNASNYTGGTLSNADSSLTLSSTSAGTYYLHVLTVDAEGNATETISSPVAVVSADAITYASANTTSNPNYTFIAPADGVYKLQVWGAQGGYRSSSTYGGKGGYSVGSITLTKGDKLYVYVGGAGNTGGTSGGYNGGGPRATYNGGGGGTDIRFVSGAWNDSASLLSRVIVAGGGGSDGATSKKGMYGGGTTGGTTTQSYGSGGGGATQTAGGTGSSSATGTGTAGTYGAFGQGGKGYSASSGYAGAGGGGWYGGAGSYPDTSGDDDRGGGGGSGFVWTSSTASNVPSGYSVGTQYYLANASTTAGNASFESTSGGTETGHTGDGYAKITAISVTGSSSTTTSSGTNGGGTEEPTYVQDGLVLHYDGIDNTGSGHSSTTTTWKDLSGNGNDGTITGGTWGGDSVQFVQTNESNGIVTQSNFPIDFSLDLTFNIVFKYTSIDGIDPLFGSRTTNTNGFMIWNFDSSVSLDTIGNSTRVAIGDRLAANTIYNLTFVFSEGTIKMYKNGTLHKQTSITTGSIEMPLTVFTAGAQSNSIGNVYSVKVYDKALNEGEILQNYKVDNTKFGFAEEDTYVKEGLVLHYDGIDNTGSGHSTTTTIWKDLSGNGNDGTITGGTWGGDSVQFVQTNESNGIVTQSNFPIDFSLDLTFNIVFKYTSIDGIDPLFGSRTTNTNGFMIWNFDSSVSLDTIGNSTRVAIGDRLAANTIYNLTFVFSEGTIKMYKNGALHKQTSITTGSIEMPLTVFTAGAQSNSIGNVYSVKVYNRALSDSEVLQNYQIDNSKYGF